MLFLTDQSERLT